MQSSEDHSLFFDVLKLTGVTFTFILISCIIQISAFVILKIPIVPNVSIDSGSHVKAFTITALNAAGTVILFYLYKKRLQLKSEPSSFYKAFSVKNLLNSLALSFTLITFITLVMLLSQKISFQVAESVDFISIGFYFFLFVIAAFTEELLNRAIFLEYLLKHNKEWIALTVSSVFFMGLHIANPGLSVWAFINLFLASIVMGQLYIYSGRKLFFPVVFHAGWNFFQGPLWGFFVSGLSVGDTIFIQHRDTNAFHNANRFGLEGDPACTIFLSIFIFLVLMKSLRKNSKVIQFKDIPQESGSGLC